MHGLFQRLRKRAPTPNRDPLEDFVTESFAWVLEANPELGQEIVRSLTGTSVPAGATITWRTQVHLPGTGYVDLVAIVEGGPVLVFEHKVWSNLSPNQIGKYRDAMRERHGDRVRTVLVTARRSQWEQGADVNRLWSEVYREVETWAAENRGQLVDDFLALLRSEGLAPAEPVAHEALFGWFPAQSLVTALESLFERLAHDLDVAKLVACAPEIGWWRTALAPEFAYKYGRLGLHLPVRPGWRPGLFAGVMLDGADHQAEPSRRELGPDFCLILDYHLEPGTPTWEEYIESPEFRRLCERLRAGQAEYGVFDVLEQRRDRQNRWHPLHLRRPLLQVLAGTRSPEDQLERLEAEIRRSVALLLEGEELQALEARLKVAGWSDDSEGP
jgi:hypothetical protein